MIPLSFLIFVGLVELITHCVLEPWFTNRTSHLTVPVLGEIARTAGFLAGFLTLNAAKEHIEAILSTADVPFHNYSTEPDKMKAARDHKTMTQRCNKVLRKLNGFRYLFLTLFLISIILTPFLHTAIQSIAPFLQNSAFSVAWANALATATINVIAMWYCASAGRSAVFEVYREILAC